MDSITECAESCEELASMFIFGTNEFGNDRCSSDGCKCICETSADDDGNCETVQHDGYRLFKFSKYHFEILHFLKAFYIYNIILDYNILYCILQMILAKLNVLMLN